MFYLFSQPTIFSVKLKNPGLCLDFYVVLWHQQVILLWHCCIRTGSRDLSHANVFTIV